MVCSALSCKPSYLSFKCVVHPGIFKFQRRCCSSFLSRKKQRSLVAISILTSGKNGLSFFCRKKNMLICVQVIFFIQMKFYKNNTVVKMVRCVYVYCKVTDYTNTFKLISKEVAA